MNIKHEARVLIIDDEIGLRENLESLLVEHFTVVVTVDSFINAISELKKNMFDVIVCDYKIDSNSGLDVRKWQMKYQPQCQFILMTGYAYDPEIVRHLETDKFKVLQKPAQASELIIPLKIDFPKKQAA